MWLDLESGRVTSSGKEYPDFEAFLLITAWRRLGGYGLARDRRLLHELESRGVRNPGYPSARLLWESDPEPGRVSTDYRWIRSIAEEVGLELAEGASEAGQDALERALGVPLSPSYRAFLGFSNGVDGLLEVWPLETVRSHCEDEGFRPYDSAPEPLGGMGMYCARLAHHLPFAPDGPFSADLVCFDTHASGEQPVYHLDHEMPWIERPFPRAPDFEAWLLESLYSSIEHIDPDGAAHSLVRKRFETRGARNLDYDVVADWSRWRGSASPG